MTLKRTRLVKVENMTSEQRSELDITAINGLVAIETHNSDYNTKARVLKTGIADYIMNGE